MTKDEFLDRFCERAGIPARYRTPDGVEMGSFRRIAVACDKFPNEHWHDGYGWGCCEGWLLIEPPKTPKYQGGEYTVTDHR